jgi:phytoene synthase
LSLPATIVRQHDRDRFQTALFAPAERREALFALYAFNYELARVREIVREPMLGRIRLQWWREVVDAAFSGGAVRRHDVVEALSAAIRAHALSRDRFERLIDAREADLDPEPLPSLAALEAYAESSSGSLTSLAAELLGAREPAALDAARDVGVGYAIAGLLRAMPFHARTGRSYIPAGVAANCGLDPDDYAARRASPALRAAVATLAAAAETHLAAARRTRREVPVSALAAMLPAIIAGRFLKRLAAAGHDPFAAALARPDPLQSWRLLAAALRGRF